MCKPLKSWSPMMQTITVADQGIMPMLILSACCLAASCLSGLPLSRRVITA